MAAIAIPKLTHHKGTDRAYITLDGRRVYLGKWNSDQSRQAYARFIVEGKIASQRVQDTLSIAALCDQYKAYAKEYYCDHHRRQTHEYTSMCLCAERLVSLYGCTAVEAFGPNSLRLFRQYALQTHGLCRSEANRLANRVKRIFKWGVAQELVPATVYQALTALEPLKRGRCNARETAPRKAVALEHVEAIQPYVAPQIWALVQLQLYTGARPSELLKLRPCDVDTSGEVSVALPAEIQQFGQLEDGSVWITEYCCALGLGVALRQQLIAVHRQKLMTEHSDTVKDVLFEYVTGQDFNNRVRAMVDTYITMQQDLASEKRALTTRWNKREKQINKILENISGMHGELEALVGTHAALPAVETLSIEHLEDDKEGEDV